MKKDKRIDINKVILIILVTFMILPSSITIFSVSFFKMMSVIIVLIFIYLFIIKKEKIKLIISNKFLISNLFFAILIAISLIANYRDMKLNDSFEIIKYIIFAMTTMIIMIICQQKKYYIFLLKTVNIVIFVISILGIIQYFNPFSINELYVKYYAPTQYETLVNQYPNPRIVGIKSNPSVYGFFMSLGVYFNFIYYEHTKQKPLFFLSILLCLINLMLTLTRTIQIAFICSIIVFTLISVLIKKGWKKALIASSTIMGLIIIILLILPKEITWRLLQVIDFSNATSWLGRTEKWENYITIFKQNLLLGIGPVKNRIVQLGYIDSEIIQNLLQYGIIGFIGYCLMLFSPLKVYLEDRKNYAILKYYIPILILVLINNISASSTLNAETAISLYIIIGLIFTKNEEKEIDE